MFFELIAAFCAAVAGAGLALIANWLSGGRLPRWAMPVAAGAAMLGYAVWSEYSWYERTRASLPEGFEVAAVNEVRAMWRPWTYAAPIVDRFAALDTAAVRRNEAVPDQRLTEMYFFGRWSPRRSVAVVVDCAGGRVAPLPTAELDASGAVSAAAWDELSDGDAALRAICA
jgi:hypothetical protein